MTNYTISDAEMKRRQAMAEAQSSVTTAMSGHALTAMEWVNVLNQVQMRMIVHGLREEWSEE